jgi:hypothetical protein
MRPAPSRTGTRTVGQPGAGHPHHPTRRPRCRRVAPPAGPLRQLLPAHPARARRSRLDRPCVARGRRRVARPDHRRPWRPRTDRLNPTCRPPTQRPGCAALAGAAGEAGRRSAPRCWPARARWRPRGGALPAPTAVGRRRAPWGGVPQGLTGAAPHRIPPEQPPRPGPAGGWGSARRQGSWQSLEVAYLPPRGRCLMPTTPSGPTEHHGHPHAARRNTCTPPGIGGRCISSAELVPRWLRAAMGEHGHQCHQRSRATAGGEPVQLRHQG